LDDKNLHNAMNFGNYPDPDIPADIAWGEMKKLPGYVPVSIQARKSARPLTGSYLLYVGFGLIVILGISYFLFPKKAPNIPDSVSYHSGGYTKKDSLPDGSTLFLDTNSDVRIVTTTGKESIITVTGAAYFEWNQAQAHSKHHIKIGSLDVTSQQATLYVSFDSVAGAVSVQLESGTVMVETGETKLSLSAGESISYDEKAKHMGEKQKADVNLYSYATRIFDFTDTPLKVAAAAIEKTYGITILFENQKLYRCRITTRFDNKTLKEMLDIMAYTLEFKYYINEKSKQVFVTGYGCM